MTPLPPRARELLHRLLEGVALPLVDHHVHVVGMGRGFGDLCPELAGEEIHLDPRRFSWRHPLRQAQTRLLMAAAGITEIPRANEQYARRLLDLVRASPVPLELHLLALDGAFTEAGAWVREETDLMVPNGLVIGLCRCLNRLVAGTGSRFVPVASIHPCRRDALDELARCREHGVTTVKWLPNVQEIDPRHRRCLPFYRALADGGMTLLTHAGRERTLRVPRPREQELGNPLHLRVALELGVRVIVAHAARDGDGRDDHGHWRPNHELFREMLAEPRWQGRLLGDLSAVSLPDTVHRLRAMGEGTLFAGRMVPGSDYPLPGVTLLDPTFRMRQLGMITREEARAARELLRAHPILGDWAIKRLGMGGR